MEAPQDWKLQPNDLRFHGPISKRGPYRYDGQSLYYLELPKNHLEEEFYSNMPYNSFSPYGVYHVYQDRKGNMWFGTSTFGACRFDGQSLAWISEREMTEIDPGPSPCVRSILEDDQGHFWYSSNMNHKYNILNSEPTSSTLNYQKISGITTSNPSDTENFYMAITQTDDGDIWMDDYQGGVWRHDGSRLIHYPIFIDNKEVLILTIYKDNNEELWLGTYNAGPLKYNGKSFEKFNP